jgi:hypothetical protein
MTKSYHFKKKTKIVDAPDSADLPYANGRSFLIYLINFI